MNHAERYCTQTHTQFIPELPQPFSFLFPICIKLYLSFFKYNIDIFFTSVPCNILFNKMWILDHQHQHRLGDLIKYSQEKLFISHVHSCQNIKSNSDQHLAQCLAPKIATQYLLSEQIEERKDVGRIKRSACFSISQPAVVQGFFFFFNGMRGISGRGRHACSSQLIRNRKMLEKI